MYHLRCLDCAFEVIRCFSLFGIHEIWLIRTPENKNTFHELDKKCFLSFWDLLFPLGLVHISTLPFAFSQDTKIKMNIEQASFCIMLFNHARDIHMSLFHLPLHHIRNTPNLV